ncbi:hypothetical protein BaRGS_00019571 [Batillaria attramentaria]|uniref:Uncharacterized protein n=1 Tax=Batillaria attramentaria TaxID=370345 RepID=A0ABD0KQJ2_9CAEN
MHRGGYSRNKVGRKEQQRMKDFLLTAISVIISVTAVVLFIALGWFIVWKLFLRKFKFVQELLGTNGTPDKAKTAPTPRRVRNVRRD